MRMQARIQFIVSIGLFFPLGVTRTDVAAAEPDADQVAWVKEHAILISTVEAENGLNDLKPLKELIGDAHVAIGFATASGSYQAIKRGKGLTQNPLQEPPAESVEKIFQSTQMPRFVLDLNAAEEDADPSAWLTKPKLFRSIGALAIDEQFQRHNLKQLFDAVIYLDQTTTARAIKR